jgi:hypothetical protein
VPVHLVVADLSDPEVRLGVLVARSGIGSTESFASMVHRAQPAAAITGTFFGVHNCLPTGDLVVDGHALYQGFVGTAIAFTGGNLVSFMRTGYKEKTAWRFFDGVMRAGPMLVQARRIVLGPRHEGFVSLSPAARRLRTAVGITAGRKLLLLAVKEPISLWRLAKLMQSLGAYHAVAMDGGTSTGLYFHGRMVAQPGRALTNALVIYADRPYEQQAELTPPAETLPPQTQPALDVLPGSALVMHVLSAADSQFPQPPDTPPLPLPTTAWASESDASEQPEPTTPGMPLTSAGETAQSPAPGAG